MTPQAGDYATAWETAVVARVDLNCLVDFGWPSFPAAADAFLAAVPAPADVADLLAALAPSDYTCPGALYAGMTSLPRPPKAAAAAEGAAGQSPTMSIDDQSPTALSSHPPAMSADEIPSAGPSSQLATMSLGDCAPSDLTSQPTAGSGDRGRENKVAKVCDALREAMQRAGAARYLKPILTSLAKVRPHRSPYTMLSSQDLLLKSKVLSRHFKGTDTPLTSFIISATVWVRAGEDSLSVSQQSWRCFHSCLMQPRHCHSGPSVCADVSDASAMFLVTMGRLCLWCAVQVDRLKDALALIKQTKEAELDSSAAPTNGTSGPSIASSDPNSTSGGSGSHGQSVPSAEEGLHHLMLSIDVEALYRCGGIAQGFHSQSNPLLSANLHLFCKVFMSRSVTTVRFADTNQVEFPFFPAKFIRLGSQFTASTDPLHQSLNHQVGRVCLNKWFVGSNGVGALDERP